MKTRKKVEYSFSSFSSELKESDTINYKSLSPAHKHLAITRAKKVFQSMRVGAHHVQTSIIPNNLILTLWKKETSFNECGKIKLAVKEAFDGGTNFYIEDNKEITNESERHSNRRKSL